MDRAKLQKEWTAIKEGMKEEYLLSDVSYNTWIKDLQLGTVNGSVITICIPQESSLMLPYYSKKYKKTKCFSKRKNKNNFPKKSDNDISPKF